MSPKVGAETGALAEVTSVVYYVDGGASVEDDDAAALGETMRTPPS